MAPYARIRLFTNASQIMPELESSAPGDLRSKSVPALKNVIMISESDFG